MSKLSDRQPGEMRPTDSVAHLAAIVASTDDAILSIDLHGTVTSWNLAAQRCYGLSPEQAIGQPITSVLPAEFADLMPDVVERVAQGEAIRHPVVARQAADGTQVHELVTLSPIYGSDGVVVGASAIVRDVSELKQAQRALEIADARYRRLVETGMLGVSIATPSGKVLEANDPWLRLLSATRDELESGNLLWSDRVVTLDDEVHQRVGRELWASGVSTPYEVEFKPVDGQSRWAAMVTALLPGVQDQAINIALDITAQKQTEQALRVRDRAMAATPSGIAISEGGTPDAPIIYVNPAFERMTGYTLEGLRSRTMLALVGSETSQESSREIGAALLDSRDAAVTLLLYRRDGSSWWCDLTLAPVRVGEDRVSHFVWLLSDVTERKLAEKQAEGHARAEKLRALGQMASGVAHDLNQSLMLIASYGSLGQRALDHETSDRDELREIFTVVTQAALDGGDTVKRLLLLARAPMQGSEPIDLTWLVREVVQLTAPRWRDASQGEGRPIQLELETIGHPIVIGSSGALRDALMNLILNAVDALPTGGTIHVRCAQRRDQACVDVADNGVGMSPEVQSRIFEPFFTTKGERGTGLGLATVFGVVEGLGGHVRVHSAPGEGTTFRLSLPASNLPLEAPPQSSTRPLRLPAEQRQLRILVVDDEPSLTRAVERLLRPIGHLVTTASSGEEALERLGAQPFDVVLSDVGMGAGMSGWDLAERVRADWPDVRFVLATGWGAGIDLTEARRKGVVAVLAKPYAAEELEQVLAAA